MKTFLRSIFPTEFYTNYAYFRALLLGVLYLATLIAQLYTFEKFADITMNFALPGGKAVALLLAWLLPLLAALSIPFLLSMRIHTRLRTISRTAVVALPLFWLVIALWETLVKSGVEVAGLFGATLPIPSGLWLIVLSALWLWAALLVVRELPRR